MRISHRACVLELGRIVAEGEPDELMKRPEIRQAYLGLGNKSAVVAAPVTA